MVVALSIKRGESLFRERLVEGINSSLVVWIMPVFDGQSDVRLTTSFLISLLYTVHERLDLVGVPGRFVHERFDFIRMTR